MEWTALLERIMCVRDGRVATFVIESGTSLVSDRCGLRFEFIDSDSRMMVSLEKVGVAPTPSGLD